MMQRILEGLLVLSECFLLSTCLLRQYHFVSQPLTWTEAQTYCRQNHTDLVTIRNHQEMKQILHTVLSADHYSEVWIGLFNEINWKWSDGSTGSRSEYRNWNTTANDPDFIAASQFCVVMGALGGWWDYVCKSNYNFICNKGTLENPDFVPVKTSMDWSSAQKHCRLKYVDLATVRNDTENQKLKSLMPSGSYSWIGLYRDPYFNWSDGSSFSFSNWDDVGNPIDSLSVTCGVTSLLRSGTWRFYSCEKRLPFVCYSVNKMKQSVKVRITAEDSVDLNNPVLKANILEKLQERLKKKGVTGITLKWREQLDGEV